jgi:hypothetical protein
MTGLELTAVWLFGIVCAAISACTVAKSRAEALTEVARHEADASRHHARAQVTVQRMELEAQTGGPVFVPAEWSEEEL